MSAPPAASSPSERRAADRRALRTPAVVTLGAQEFEVRTLDISPGGLGIVAGANPRPGTTFQIRFKLPLKPRGALPVALPVRVVHAVFSADEGGFKVGLMFLQLPPEVAQAIIRYMK